MKIILMILLLVMSTQAYAEVYNPSQQPWNTMNQMLRYQQQRNYEQVQQQQYYQQQLQLQQQQQQFERELQEHQFHEQRRYFDE